MLTPEVRAEALWRTRTHLPDVIIRNQADLDDIARTAAAIYEAVQEEREACARIVEMYRSINAPRLVAAEIRARSQEKP